MTLLHLDKSLFSYPENNEKNCCLGDIVVSHLVYRSRWFESEVCNLC